MAAGTAEAMARGGIYDQLGGGFARYSVDAGWVVPHFEKMLYDNALLARVYAHLWRRTGSALAGRVAGQTCAWMIRELRTEQGGFASALDADSEGEEGKFYAWTGGELREVLGPGDGEYAAQVFGVTEDGTFEHGRSVLQLRADPSDAGRLARIRADLFKARERRVRPARDDKVVAAWNGLAIAALAEAGLLLDRPEFVTAARNAAEAIARVHLADGRLARTSREGAAGSSAGVLDDYACVADGFLALSGVTPLSPADEAALGEPWEKVRNDAPAGVLSLARLAAPASAPAEVARTLDAFWARKRSPLLGRALSAFFSARAWTAPRSWNPDALKDEAKV